MANSLKAIVYGAVSSIGIAPFVPYVRDSWSEPYLSRRVARLLRALVAIRAAGVLANSSATLADVGSGIAVPSPLEARMFEVPDMAHHHETVTMGLVGRWAPWKGQDFVIEACQGLDIPWTLNLVGDALFGELDYAADIRERIERDARIEQRGHVDDVVGELARVQVVVNGSLIREPFGNVIVEAMAAGRIVVAPSDAGAAKRIEHAVNGFVYERGSMESLRAVLGEVWAARSYWHEIAARARRAVSDIRADHIAPVVESVWDEVSA
jgi:glycosyltransferase involved in cell wall biosynthesis